MKKDVVFKSRKTSEEINIEFKGLVVVEKMVMKLAVVESSLNVM